MEIIKQIFKDAMIYMGTIFAVLFGCLILAIPAFIGIAMNSIPIVLFGIVFFTAFAAAIFTRVVEREVKKNERT